MKEEQLFHQALEQPADQRALFLDRACSGDADLRERVEVLLHAHLNPGSFLEWPPGAICDSRRIDQPLAERPGTTIDRYKLLQEIGQGGMGVVYMAEQKEPVERRVALKIIKPGMDTRQVITRFDAERHALAMMDHPNIARVLDAGATETGRPYFVMELVQGVPITQHCDEHHLTPRERLELFVPVCNAVQHAHQKGIIHRDIKPSNVIVAEYDDRPMPKIIDFGVAKAIEQRLTDKSMFTQFGQVVGTIDYMSPEQAKLNQLDIDTRSDIYSLGVLLYELLTGETPLDRQRLRSAAFDEMLRIIREEEPPRPSMRLSSSRSLSSIAANRQTEPKKLSTLVHGELDWIVMKAMEKDRTRRYETANGFAADIERYLSDEPVLACPPSAVYRLRKFVRRNKGPVVAVSLVLLALVAGIVGTTLGLLEARTAAEAEAQQRQAAEASEKKASEEAAVAKAVRQFLQHDLLGLAGVEAQLEADIEPDPNLKLTTLLDRALAKVDERFADQPRVRAEVQVTLARAYGSIGRYAEAVRLWEQVRQYREAVRPKHPDTLGARDNLAQAYGWAGQYNEALELSRQTLELKRTILGPEHPETIKCMHILATIHGNLGQHADAMKLREETLAWTKAKLGPDHPDTQSSMHNLANSYAAVRRHADALKLREEVLLLRKTRLGPHHPYTIGGMSSLADSYAKLGRRADALKLYEETLAWEKAKFGPDHPCTLSSMHNLANWHQNFGRHADALKLHEETLKLRKARLGPDHPDTLKSMFHVALCYFYLDRRAEALKLQEETLALSKAKLGPDHPITLKSMGSTAVSYYELGRYAEALKLHEEALALRKAGLGPDHPDTLKSMSNVASCYDALGRHTDGLKLHEETLALMKANLGPNHRETLVSMVNIAVCQGHLGWHAEALKLHQESLALREAKLGSDHPDTLQSMWRVAESLVQLNRGAEVVPIIDEFLKRAEVRSVRPGLIPTMLTLRLRHFEKAKDAAGCRATAELWEKMAPTHALSVYDAACWRAVTAAVIRTSDKSETAAKDVAAEADRAMAWLKQAVAAGYNNAAHMKKDTDLDVLRDREDFRKLLADLEADQGETEKVTTR